MYRKYISISTITSTFTCTLNLTSILFIISIYSSCLFFSISSAAPVPIKCKTFTEMDFLGKSFYMNPRRDGTWDGLGVMIFNKDYTLLSNEYNTGEYKSYYSGYWCIKDNYLFTREARLETFSNLMDSLPVDSLGRIQLKDYNQPLKYSNYIYLISEEKIPTRKYNQFLSKYQSRNIKQTMDSLFKVNKYYYVLFYSSLNYDKPFNQIDYKAAIEKVNLEYKAQLSTKNYRSSNMTNIDVSLISHGSFYELYFPLDVK